MAVAPAARAANPPRSCARTSLRRATSTLLGSSREPEAPIDRERALSPMRIPLQVPPALRAFAICSGALLLASSCTRAPELVVYCALDQEHAEPILARFERETGLDLDVQFDVEANKTVGLVARIKQESSRPRCDVFWNNECAHSAALAEQGLLQPYESPNAVAIPAQYKDAQHRWTGFAARARVLIVNTDRLDPARVHGWAELLAPEWAGQVSMARPLTGTTLTHMAALFALRGEAPMRALLRDLAERNAAGRFDLASGNANVMRMVRDGQVAFGWTDSDDYNVAREQGFHVAQVLPDQDGEGCLLIPNSVAIVRGAPHPEAARRLIDYLLAPAVEEELARSRSAQIPLRAEVPRPAHVVAIDELVQLRVDWPALGRELEQRQLELKEIFLK